MQHRRSLGIALAALIAAPACGLETAGLGPSGVAPGGADGGLLESGVDALTDGSSGSDSHPAPDAAPDAAQEAALGDALADAPPPPDAGTDSPSLDPGVACGLTSCSSGFCSRCGGEFLHCVGSDPNCQGGVDILLACDDSNECGAQKCCVCYDGSNYAHSECRSACNDPNCANTQHAMCSPYDLSCTSGTCQPTNIAGGAFYGVCR